MKRMIPIALLWSFVAVFAQAECQWNVPTGDWSVPGNWSGGNVPSVSSGGYVYIQNGGTAHITAANAATQDRLLVGGQATGLNGVLQVDGGALNVGGFALFVGRQGSSGAVSITNDGSVTSSRGYIGHNGSSSTGTVTVDGSNSTWTITDTDSYALIIGDKSGDIGTVNIRNGATVSVAATFSRLGQEAGSVGEINITGSGSALIQDGIMLVGRSGAGTLTITSNALVRVNGMTIDNDVTNADGVVRMSTGGQLALEGSYADLSGFLGKIDGTDHIEFWNDTEWDDIGNAIAGADYLITAGSNDLAGFTVLTVDSWETESIALGADESITIPISDTAAGSDEVYLSFSARINTQGRYSSGSAVTLMLSANNVPISIERLENKRSFYIFNSVNKVNWYWGNDGWSVTYYPWDMASAVPGGEVHNYVFDIKTLMRSDPGSNFITLKNTDGSVSGAFLEIVDLQILNSDDFSRSPLLEGDTVVSKSEGLKQFRDLAISYHDGVEVELSTDIDYQANAVQNIVPGTSFDQDYQMSLDVNGELEVEVNGDSYVGVSYFRTSGGGWRSIGEPGSSLDWNQYVVTSNSVYCENNALRLTRTFTEEDSYILVEDVFENKTSSDLPVVVMNTIDVLSLSELGEFRIAGEKQPIFYSNTSTMDSRKTGATPVVYLEKTNSGLGVVLQDDVYRNHATYLAWNSTLGIGDELFYLAPGSQYTMVWKIFPVQERNYYQLVNAIRNDWAFSREIPGLFGFVHPTSDNYYLYEDAQYKTPEEIAMFLADTGLDVASSLAVLPRGDGYEGLTGNESLSQYTNGTSIFRDWSDKAALGGADVISLPYMDVHLVKPYFDSNLANVDVRLPDSLIKDAYGDYVPYSSGSQWLVLPSLDNACGTNLMNIMAAVLDEQGFDGLYLDEWDHSRARVSFNHPDGYSALLDTNANLVAQIGFIPLLTRDFQQAFVDEIAGRGKMVYANQFDHTMSSAQLPVIHFAEPLESANDYKLYAAQLTATPLSLHVKSTSSLWSDVQEFLKRGVLTCYYLKYLHGDHILKKCFPITVKEVWPGCVVGERKIVTLCSGSYGFGRKNSLAAYIYGGTAGELLRTEASVQSNGVHQISLSLEEGQVAVVEEMWVLGGLSHFSDNVLEMVIDYCPDASASYLKISTNLVSGTWVSAAHSTNGAPPFIVTNLDYSAVSGSSKVIYLEATNSAAYFRFEEE